MSDPQKVSSALPYSSGDPKSFTAARKYVLEILNDLFRETEQYTPEKRMEIDFLKRWCGAWMTGFLVNTGILDMLEANNYEHIDHELLLLG